MIILIFSLLTNRIIFIVKFLFSSKQLKRMLCLFSNHFLFDWSNQKTIKNIKSNYIENHIILKTNCLDSVYITDSPCTSSKVGYFDFKSLTLEFFGLW